MSPQRKGQCSEEHVGKVVLGMVSGLPRASLTTLCVARLGLDERQTEAVIAEARRRVTLAADFDRDEELGRAAMRLNDLYARNFADKDFKGALSAQKELNRLLGLYPVETLEPSPEDLDAPAEDGQVLAALAHLRPLRLGGDGDSIVEQCRLAVARIIGLESRESRRGT